MGRSFPATHPIPVRFPIVIANDCQQHSGYCHSSPFSIVHVGTPNIVIFLLPISAGHQSRQRYSFPQVTHTPLLCARLELESETVDQLAVIHLLTRIPQ